ncbi:MAG: hypothetical protein QXM94_03370 [Thermoplasmata archaeon]
MDDESNTPSTVNVAIAFWATNNYSMNDGVTHLTENGNTPVI